MPKCNECGSEYDCPDCGMSDCECIHCPDCGELADDCDCLEADDDE